MARATNKTELLEAADINFNKLLKLICTMTDEDKERTFSFEDRDKNLRDVLSHLYEWHQLLLNWITQNVAGNDVSFLPAPYNWKTYPQMNIELWEKHQKTPLNVSMSSLTRSHSQVVELINSFTNEELFVKKHYKWTGTTNLGSYCISATSSHYDWAKKKLKKHLKEKER